MSFRDQILAHAHRLTIDRGVIPSLNAVAEAAGVSKGGLTHHFPTRDSLVDGLARLALEEIDAAMLAAVETGTVASTWLRSSVPSGDELRLFRALAVAHRALESPGAQTVADASAAIDRWEGLIADEVGDPVLARVIRLVGDGLAMNAFAGMDVSGTVDLARLEEHLMSAAQTARS